MNIIEVNFEKLKKYIDEYILYNNDGICLSVGTVIAYDKPIILMNNDTLNFLKTKNKYFTTNNTNVPMVFGCYIAVAEWLPFGEVELK